MTKVVGSEGSRRRTRGSGKDWRIDNHPEERRGGI